ncbi:MAG: V-type ATP synthase subunit E [Treponema sp.]|jgi:V/A-type H+-transporting ATPase subunit E|nr:V-type ATP synthase subunit E [Treponema sp.]
MDIQVQELINKIKKDGIESASQDAARLKQEAEAEAKQIVEAAKKEAAEIIAKGKQDAERSEKAGVAALGQASRNLVLAFKGEVQALLDRLVAEELASSYSSDVLKTALPEILKAWGEKGTDSLAVLLPEASLDKLMGFFKTKLAAEFKNGLELRSDRNLAAGFRIANKDGSAYYDFSADAVAEMLCAYLNPRLAEILRTAAKKL